MLYPRNNKRCWVLICFGKKSGRKNGKTPIFMGLIRVVKFTNFIIVKRSGTMDTDNTHEKVSLTKRELDVLRLLAKGYTSTWIAEELGIGQSTVMDHRKKLHKKMKVNRVGELVFKATELHLI